MVFADTFYFLALLSPSDAAHQAVVEYIARTSESIITTAWVLTEVADGLASTSGRRLLADFVRELEDEAEVTVVLPDEQLWRRGLDLYAQRPDKEWSLTDCISFVVMQERGVVESLTAAHHFEQAGFVALLK